MSTALRSGAELSADGRYRYSLTREWSTPAARLLLWVMLNPSTADAEQDDPTIRRCIGFTKREGYDGLVVVNLCAFRSTDPKALGWDAAGPDNRAVIERWLADSRVDRVVAAWGANTPPARTPVLLLAETAGVPLVCLGRTKSGAPRHPLYVKADAAFEALT